jgi:hypothetical protein
MNQRMADTRRWVLWVRYLNFLAKVVCRSRSQSRLPPGGRVTNSFLGILASSLDTSSLHPRGAKYQGEVGNDAHNKDKYVTSQNFNLRFGTLIS